MKAVHEEREICLDSEYPPVPLAYHRYLWIADLCEGMGVNYRVQFQGAMNRNRAPA